MMNEEAIPHQPDTGNVGIDSHTSCCAERLPLAAGSVLSIPDMLKGSYSV